MYLNALFQGDPGPMVPKGKTTLQFKQMIYS